MMSIFEDMIDKFVEVFMDGPIVYEDTFYECLEHLERVLIRETNLVLNGRNVNL